MKLQEGVHLHFISTDKFTTNQIKVRFAAPMDEKTVAGRVLATNILEMGNQDFPNQQAIRKYLASLYGASFSTSISRRGSVHLVDVTMSYINEKHLLDQEDLTNQILRFLEATLFRPLVTKGTFDSAIFDLEKNNLLAYLESEVEDNFYHADLELNRLFFTNHALQIPRVSTVELVQKETATTAYKALQDMLRFDRIDIFVMGQVDRNLVTERFEKWKFAYRNPKLEFEYQQEFSTVLREKSERKEANQSILELAYHLQLVYNDVNYTSLLVFNGILGAFSHSKLFVNVREKEGLAYTVGTQINIFSGLLRVYAGIDKDKRLVALRAIQREFRKIKSGQISDQELELTKKMLLHAVQVAEDKGRHLIETAYHQELLGDRFLTKEKFTESVLAVNKEDVVRVASLVRLQAIYFMEGME